VEGVRRIVIVAATVTVAAACGGSSHHEASPPSTTHALAISTTTAAPTTSTTLDPTKAAILAAYRASWADFDVVATHYPVDPTNPVLTNHMAGNQLIRVRNSLTALKLQDLVLQGPPVDTSLALVNQIIGNAAVVADCDFDPSVSVKGTTGQPIDKPTTRRTLINAELQLISGTWKVTKSTTVRVGCNASV
jgi:hypothetical protein